MTLAIGPHADNPVRILRQVSLSDSTLAMIRFDYASGTASRVVVDERSGKALREHVYPGRPQSSRQEFQDAVSISAATRRSRPWSPRERFRKAGSSWTDLPAAPKIIATSRFAC